MVAQEYMATQLAIRRGDKVACCVDWNAPNDADQATPPERLMGSDAIEMRQQRHARELLARVRPYDEWKAERRRTPEEKDAYWWIVRALEDVASGRDPAPTELP